MAVLPITQLSAPEEQHLLLLFLPLRTGTPSSAVVPSLNTLFSGKALDGPDPRYSTGVHFYMTYAQTAGEKTPGPPPPFPAFQLPPPNPETNAPRDLAVVLSIYDADFAPYIEAFTTDPGFAATLDATLLVSLDETGFVSPDDPTSAAWILANGGVFNNQDAFLALLMRYNWADPTIPAATTASAIAQPNPDWKYFLGATFPGQTAGLLLDNYPNAAQLWPNPGVTIDYAPSAAPPQAKSGAAGGEGWCAQQGSNLRPLAPEASALSS